MSVNPTGADAPGATAPDANASDSDGAATPVMPTHVPTAELLVQWAPPTPPQTRPRGVVASWALSLAVLALVVSLIFGWGLPVGLTAVVLAVVALFRAAENRSVAKWALWLGVISVVYSTGWAIWMLVQLDIIG